MQYLASPRLYAFVGLLAVASLAAFVRPTTSVATTEPIPELFDDTSNRIGSVRVRGVFR